MPRLPATRSPGPRSHRRSPRWLRDPEHGLAVRRGVGPVVAATLVGLGATVERVVAPTAAEGVDPDVSLHLVVAGPAADPVRRALADNPVVAAPGEDHVRLPRPHDLLALVGADDRRLLAEAPGGIGGPPRGAPRPQ